ncbi:ribonuclease YeeF family protein [Terribacillus saccharophilus]|uniref:ribonuclease YeeF family protein n=1 Tax=Terribacillus saccharophilus TaxID=361277 RepID=UPI002DC7810B|nr:T7SS effector LXG polymorphic toxin [Terribacillus saccharophilus]MEC0291651.1 T7SS effector LXG polymorphic toxin [Terribacillus saccharophilus]
MTKIKNLDVQDIQQQVDSTKDFISKTKENVEQVKQALNGVTTLHDGFAGNTADSIRSFYEEAHKPFLEFMESFLVQYEQALNTVSDQVLSFEPNESGFIRQEFLEGELTNKMQKAQDSLSATTDMINQQLNSVSDLASVSHLKDSVFLESIADAKKKISKTVDNMYEMDSNATSKLDKSEDDMQQMKTYMSKLRNAIDKNNISVENFNITQFNSEFFSYHNEFKLMAKGRNALATGEKAEITAEEFNKLYPYIKNEKNVIDEYYEWDGTYHTLKDGRIIRHYMHDTGESYEFVDKIPEPRAKPLSDTEEFIYGAVGGVWNFFTEDLATVLDPGASYKDKIVATAMFLPIGKPVKLLDKGSVFVSDGIKSLEKIIDNNNTSKKVAKEIQDNNTGNVNIFKPGDKSQLAPGGGLKSHELKGGHLLDRHVGKTDKELLDRLKSNSKITGSSSFTDRATAEKVASSVLVNPKNKDKIQKWLENPNSRPTLPLNYKGDGSTIGRSASRNSETVEDVANAKVILRKDKDGSFILTGYPVK